MPLDLPTALKPFLERMQTHLAGMARADPAFRDLLAAVGDNLRALADGAAPTPPPPVVVPPVAVAPQSAPPLTAAPPPAPPVPSGPSIRELAARLWTEEPRPPSAAPRPAASTYPGADREADFLTVASRCRVKAAAARWAAEGRDLAAGADLIAQAQLLPECFL